MSTDTELRTYYHPRSKDQVYGRRLKHGDRTAPGDVCSAGEHWTPVLERVLIRAVEPCTDVRPHVPPSGWPS